MSKRFLILLAIIIIAGVVIFASKNKTEAPSVPSSLAVMYTDDGYSPGSLKIKVGETVIFQNDSGRTMWTASAMHPTHMVYPETNIQKCDSPESMTMFDACDGVLPGKSWSFQFNHAGEWGYHNHLNSSHYGKIIVE